MNNLIIPCIQSPSYNFLEFVTEILSNITTFKFCVKNSSEIISLMNDLTLTHDYILVSLDVISLFTNIPKSLVVECITLK